MEKENALMVTVDAARLSQSLKTVFLGVAGVFDSLGGNLTQVEQAAESAVVAVTEDAPSAEQYVKPEMAAPPQDKPIDEATPDAAPPMPEESQPEPETETVSTLTINDIIRVAAKKIEANRKNNEKIGKLVKAYGLASLKELSPAKFEAFMTDLSQI